MATGGLGTALLAADTTDNKTSVEEPWSTTASQKYMSWVWEDLRNLFQQDQLTDVMLAAGGQPISCHRVLLAAASKFFYDKFVVHPESLENNLLDIEGTDVDTLTDIVSFVYNGHPELALEKAEILISASVSLMLPELTDMCKDFLLHTVSHDTSSCIDIHRIAKNSSLTEIADRAWQIMLGSFQEVYKLNAFLKMSEIDLQDYISDERLNVANENPVFEAVVTWVKYEMENRGSSFENLMENVILSNCSLQFLGEVVRKEQLMETGKCFQHFFDALYHHATSPKESGTARGGANIKATGGMNAELPAVGGDTTDGKKTSTEELWSTTAGAKYRARARKDLGDLLQQDELTDVMLAAEGQSIPCHRVLLAAASKFFYDKFVVHPESLEHNLLDIEGIDFDTLTDIVLL